MQRRAKALARGPEAGSLSPRLRFRRAVSLCLLSAVAPGSAQIIVGNRWVGRIALLLWVALLGTLAYLGWQYRDDRAGAIGLAADSDVLLGARIGLAVVALFWVVLFLDAWRLARPFRLPVGRATVVLLLNTALLLGVLGTTVYASQLATVQREVVQTVFTETETSEPLHGRYNILLVGSDSGKGRTGIRPDSMTVVSIDASTGKAVLVSLPRNLQNVPFREDSPMRELYPYGYNCGSECLLNAVHTAVEGRADLYPDSDDPGLDATIDAVEGATDLTINYYVMINLKGFRSLVDAVGGVEMDVKTRLAKFGQEDSWKQEYIEPGRQVLDGDEALWYARSRVQSDDYTRMGRQKCLMAAMLDQLSPQTVLLNATDIARSSAELLTTNIPAEELGAFADLALKAKDGRLASVSLVPPAVSTVTPDFALIHEMIKDAIRKSERTTTPRPEPTETETLEATPSPGATATPPGEDPTLAAANNADDLKSAC